MKLRGIIRERRQEILGKWFGLVLSSYPPETAKFLKSRKDRFANPVGSTIYESLEGILKGFLSGDRPDALAGHIDGIMRIRAVQDFTASGAVAFVFGLKSIIRGELDEVGEGDIAELLQLEDTVDMLALMAFETYTKCREDIYEVKSNELARMTRRLLERANDALTDEEKSALKAGTG